MATKRPSTRYLFVTGGVLSGVGKGITAASIGNILKARGLSVNIQKCDPYLNVDAGTLNPAEHGECFVTADGAETDLDLGHYERFIDQELTQASSLMSGKILKRVISDERHGKYLGKTVQIIPHVTNAISREIQQTGQGFDVHIVEIGGTVGDYESLSFIEAIRELSMTVGQDYCAFVHVVYLPYLGASKEIKTKPAQNAVRELRGLGIVPDVLVARSETMPHPHVINKLSLYSGVKPEAIVLLPNADSIYQVPLTLEDNGIAEVILQRLSLAKKAKKPKLTEWEHTVKRAMDKNAPVKNVGIVAKYLNNQDTYMSVFEALKSAAWAINSQVNLHWIDAEELEGKSQLELHKSFAGIDGIVVPGGFGKRALEGKINAATYAAGHNLPYLGLCLGLQMAVIAAARLSGVEDANSLELDPNCANPVIATMNDQKGKENTGGTMRLGNYICEIQKDTLASKLYKTAKIVERHRHRYECNNKYRTEYEKWGLKASGLSPDGELVEMIEMPSHKFFLASQFHPEFKSRPNKPHPMFLGFVKALQTKV